jgi:hypothetical protein
MKEINKKKHKNNGKCFRALPLHYFFTNDSIITKTSSIIYDGKLVSKSQWTTQICRPFVSKAKC